jgi:hypothetical protein
MWNIIRTENLISKDQKRNYDMKALLTSIGMSAEQRIQTKLDSIAINMGYKSRADFPKESIYPIIYKLSEKNEYYVQLEIILKTATINSTLKAKLGKKKLSKTEELTADYIKKLMNSTQLEINGLKKELEDFNSKAELDISKAYMYLAA